MAAPSYDTWDYDTLKPGAFSMELYNRSYEGGRNVLGIAYAANYTAGGCWKITYRNINIFSSDQHRAWIKAAALFNGGTTPVNVLINPRRINPFDLNEPEDKPTIDQAVASIKAAMGDGADVYASTIKVRVERGTTLKAGHLFSINHDTEGWRMYMIKSVGTSTDSPTTDSDAILYSTVKITPPLRHSSHEGEKLEMDWPRVACRLAPGQNMPWDVEDWWSSAPDVTFVEYFVRS